MTTTDNNHELYIIPLVLTVILFVSDYSLVASVLCGLALCVAIYFYQTGQLQEVYPKVRSFLIKLKPTSNTIQIKQYDVCLGHNTHARPIVHNLEDIHSIAIWGITRSGKTSLLRMLIHSLISTHSEKEIKLIITDLKHGLSYSIYKRIPHLLLPVVGDIDDAQNVVVFLLDELAKRALMFKAIPDSELCDSLEAYHELIDLHGYNLSKLPRIVAIFDECQLLTQDKKTTQRLIDIAKLGLAYGVHLVLATQYADVNSIPGPLRGQLGTKLVGRFASDSEYYQLARVPKSIYEKYHLKTGEFFYQLDGESYQKINVRWVPKNELKKTAKKLSQLNEPSWPQKTTQGKRSVKMQWKGNSTQEKIAIIRQLANELGRRPTALDFCERVEASQRTAETWIPKAMEGFEI